MTRKKESEEPTFETYEPGEPAEQEASKRAAEIKAEQKAALKRHVKIFFQWTLMIVVAAIVVSGIVFGINRWVHAVNEDIRYKEKFYTSCIAQGNHVLSLPAEQGVVCFEGTVVQTVDVNTDNWQKECYIQGGVAAIDAKVPYSVCVKGRIVAIR